MQRLSPSLLLHDAPAFCAESTHNAPDEIEAFRDAPRAESLWRFGTLAHARSGEAPYIQHRYFVRQAAIGAE